MKSSADCSEWLPLTKAALRSPDKAVFSQHVVNESWQKLNYHKCPDLDLAVEEHAQFASILENSGAEILRLGNGDGLTLDSIYARDSALATPDGLILSIMGKDDRQGEPEELHNALTTADIAVAGKISPPGRFEGGDCVWLDKKTLLIGRTYRTNDAAIEQVREILGPEYDVVSFALPHFKGPSDVFHLMSIISPVDKDLAVVYLPLMPVPMVEFLADRNIQFVEVDDEEFHAMACNVLALGNRRAVMLDNLPRTKAKLEDADVDVFTFSGDQLCRPGEGGPTCLTLPLARG